MKQKPDVKAKPLNDFAEEAEPRPQLNNVLKQPLRQQKPAKHLVVITTIFIEAIEKISDRFGPGRWYTRIARGSPATRLPRPKKVPDKAPSVAVDSQEWRSHFQTGPRGVPGLIRTRADLSFCLTLNSLLGSRYSVAFPSPFDLSLTV